MIFWLLLGGLGVYFVAHKSAPTKAAPDNAPSPSPSPAPSPSTTPSVKVDNGTQVYVPPTGIDTQKVIKDAMLSYHRGDNPTLVTAGPLAGAVEFKYVLSASAPQITDQSELAAFVQAGMMIDNKGSEPFVLVFKTADVDAIFAGKRPDPLMLYLATKSLAAKICTPGSPYVMVATTSSGFNNDTTFKS